MKKLNYLLFVLGMLTRGSLLAQQMGNQSLAQIQESPAGSRIIDYLDAINGGEDISEDWIKGAYAPKLVKSMEAAKLAAMMKETQEMEGTLQLYNAKRTSMFKYRLMVFGVKSGEWLEMVFSFEENHPYRISGITLDSTDAEPEASEPIYPAQ